jgi:hypothetical protein
MAAAAALEGTARGRSCHTAAAKPAARTMTTGRQATASPTPRPTTAPSFHAGSLRPVSASSATEKPSAAPVWSHRL